MEKINAHLVHWNGDYVSIRISIIRNTKCYSGITITTIYLFGDNRRIEP